MRHGEKRYFLLQEIRTTLINKIPCIAETGRGEVVGEGERDQGEKIRREEIREEKYK